MAGFAELGHRDARYIRGIIDWDWGPSADRGVDDIAEGMTEMS